MAEGVKDLNRAIVFAIGLVLIAAGSVEYFFAIGGHAVQGGVTIGLILAGGSILSAVLCLLDRSGEASLFSAGILLALVIGARLWLPPEDPGIGGAFTRISLLFGSVVSLTIGVPFVALGIRW
jgi:hypothetical protein